MKKLLLLAFVCVTSMSFGQSNSKMDPYLAIKLENYTLNKSGANLMLPMLIQGNIDVIKQLVMKNGGVFKYSYGNVAAIVIPVNSLLAFNNNIAVKRMEGAPPRNRPLDDSSNVKNHIIQVLNGNSPLPQAYNGRGIVMGFIDTGIDYLHDDFRDSSGTRVQYYWDMNQPYSSKYTMPPPWNYGQSWTKAQLDSGDGNDSSACIVSANAHGTNVAGAGVGNGRCNGYQLGGCPKSDIIAVAYDFDNQTATMFTDAAQYIFQCADSLNEPCVINASMGGDDGSHDDSDLQGQMIDNMLAAKQPGRVFVAALGNSGTPYHVHDSLPPSGTDTNFTWYKYDPANGCKLVDIPVFANETDFNNVKFRLRVDKVQTGSYTERDTMTVYTSISHLSAINTTSVYNKNGNRLGVVTSYKSIYGSGSYSLEFQITPDTTSYYWGLEVTGTGRFDVWDFCNTNDVIDSTGLKISEISYSGIKKYKQPDTMMTLCSSYQCSPHVISAQTYFNRDSFPNCSGSTTKNPNGNDIPGAFVWTSSKGPTRNFILAKPDVSASGNYTLSALPVCFTVCNVNTDAIGCHNEDGGTSMASPMVASAAALFMEKYPRATDSNVKQCIKENTYTDKFTGPVSISNMSYNWGAGKLDAFAAMTSPCALTIDVPTITHKGVDCKLSAYPNPYTSTTNIDYDFSAVKDFNTASIVVYDMMGKAVKTLNLKGNQGTVILDRTNLGSGVYFYSLVVDGARLKTEKLVVM